MKTTAMTIGTMVTFWFARWTGPRRIEGGGGCPRLVFPPPRFAVCSARPVSGRGLEWRPNHRTSVIRAQVLGIAPGA
jgi:hypothetical protein